MKGSFCRIHMQRLYFGPAPNCHFARGVSKNLFLHCSEQKYKVSFLFSIRTANLGSIYIPHMGSLTVFVAGVGGGLCVGVFFEGLDLAALNCLMSHPMPTMNKKMRKSIERIRKSSATIVFKMPPVIGRLRRSPFILKSIPGNAPFV